MPAGVVADPDLRSSEAALRHEANNSQLDVDADKQTTISGTTARDSGDYPRSSEETINEEARTRTAALHSQEIEA